MRNDLLTEEINGPQPAAVTRQARRDGGLEPIESYGTPGTDTVPGQSGPATALDKRNDPADSAVAPLLTFGVTDPERTASAAPASQQLLVDGDGSAVVSMARDGITDGHQPIRLLGSLDQRSFATAVRDGGRLVLTDTNRRRAWDGNRIGNATSPTLSATGDVDSGNGGTTTLWPDEPAKQTVTELAGGASVTADKPGFGLHPYGRPSNAFDGDPTTAWVTGGFSTATGNRIRLRLDAPRLIESVTLQPLPSGPSRITAVAIRVGDNQVVQVLPPDGSAVKALIVPTRADEVQVTILGQTPGLNPVGISSINVDDITVREVTRLPETMSRLAKGADAATRRRLAALPLEIELARAQGAVADPGDDEESQLDRRFTLPDVRTMTFSAELASSGTDPAVVAAAAAGGDDTCRTVARLDGTALQARVTSTPNQVAAGRILLEGCSPLDLAAGRHQLRGVFGWRLDHVRLSAPGAESDGARTVRPDGSRLRIASRTATRIEATLGASAEGARLFRLGEAYDDRWSLSIDGRDAGPPILVDGYSTGWRVDGRAHRLVITFSAERVVKATFVLSLAGLVGVVALVVLPAPATDPRRRWRLGSRRGPRSRGRAPAVIGPVSRRGLGAVGAWVALAVVAGALDGAAGVAVAVAVAGVLLARLPAEWLARLGVSCLLVAPVWVLAEGLPSAAEVSPGFVTRSLVPQHLVFGGFALLASWVVLDMARHVRSGAHVEVQPEAALAPVERLGRTWRGALFGVVLMAATVVSVAVLAR